jgi:hypothetical protein
MSEKLDKLRVDAMWGIFMNGTRRPGETAEQFTDRVRTRCATVGHGLRAATHELTYSLPESRDQAERELVCGECADGYARRPMLKATARPL